MFYLAQGDSHQRYPVLPYVVLLSCLGLDGQGVLAPNTGTPRRLVSPRYCPWGACVGFGALLFDRHISNQREGETVAHRTCPTITIQQDGTHGVFRCDSVDALGREHAVRAAESDDRRAPDRFADMATVTKLRVRDSYERAERPVRV